MQPHQLVFLQLLDGVERPDDDRLNLNRRKSALLRDLRGELVRSQRLLRDVAARYGADSFVTLVFS
ncbi:MAG: hypothetical protein Q4G65_10405 [bacterium]|nr:hypothetical protein [bacterium]